MKKIFPLIAFSVIFLAPVVAHNAFALTFEYDFEEADIPPGLNLQHGHILSKDGTDFGFFDLFSMEVVNIGFGPDWAVIFDTTLENTQDFDLEDPWIIGNLPADTVLGNVLIIQENDIDANNDEIADEPKSEDDTPAGFIFLDFGSNDVFEFGFDFVDLDNVFEDSEISFLNQGSSFGTISFSEFADPNSIFFVDNGVLFGDKSVNRVPPVNTQDLFGSTFNQIQISVGGSVAFDNFVFSIDMTQSTEICDNNADDDNDGLVDCFDGDCALDPVCAPSTAEDCSNLIDDDGDSLTDCNDPDCALVPMCIDNSQVIGGKIIPTESASLLLAGIQFSFAWILPIILAGAGIAAYKLGIKNKIN